MGVLFRHDDALILGYLLSPYFRPPYKVGGSYIYSTGYDYGFILGGLPSTGAGGGLHGDNGKPMVNDATQTTEAYASVAGYGGYRSSGGKGYRNGQFGKGGGDNQALYSLSCGGGSGWFGGGSSYVGAGGGGGSGFVLTVDENEIPEGYAPPASYFNAIGETVQYLSGIKTGHGLCKINDDVFEYTGDVQMFVVPSAGLYKIECFGAQGGGVNGVQESYAGGKGGYVSGEFMFPAGLVLYIYVGKEGGESGVSAFNGGGIGLGGAYGGGGATDVRWSGELGAIDTQSNLYDRFIVAGGGGGQGKISNDMQLLNNPIATNISPSGRQNEQEVKTEPALYIVNDNTICTVDLTYVTSQDIAQGDTITVKLYADDEYKGSVTKPALSGGGMDSFKFNFSDYLPPDTPSYWSKLEAKVETSSELPLVIPPKGLIIRLSTELQEGEKEAPTDKPVLYLTRNAFKVDFLTLLDIYKVELESGIGETVDDPDHVADIVLVEDLNQFTLVRGSISDDFDNIAITDSADYTKVSVLRYDPTVDSIEIRDVFKIEGLGEEQENLDALLDDYNLTDFHLIDARVTATSTSTDEATVNDIHSYSKSTVYSYAETESLTMTSVYLVEGINDEPPSLDALVDDYEILDVQATFSLGVSIKTSRDDSLVEDIYTFSKVSIIHHQETESTSITDVHLIELN